MKKTINLLLILLPVIFAIQEAKANSAPVVTNVIVNQRNDDSKLVDIHYDLADADADDCTIWVAVSNDNGISWRVPARTFTGDIGQGVLPGTNKSIVWDAGADMPGKVGSFKVRIFADDGNGPGPMVLVGAGWFPYQNASDPEGWVFVDTFLIDKYEVTNAFYCQFLNNFDPDGNYWSPYMEIDRWGDASNYSYTVHMGKENYPIRCVCYYDAQAFAQWRSNLDGVTYQLPTEYQWEKAAAWDPVEQHFYMYGFHKDNIDCTWCNYNNCVGRSTQVGHYNGTNGTNDAKSFYGCYDMSGNVWEWMKNSDGLLRSGEYSNYPSNGTTTLQRSYPVNVRYDVAGFRLVREIE